MRSGNKKREREGCREKTTNENHLGHHNDSLMTSMIAHMIQVVYHQH